MAARVEPMGSTVIDVRSELDDAEQNEGSTKTDETATDWEPHDAYSVSDRIRIACCCCCLRRDPELPGLHERGSAKDNVFLRMLRGKIQVDFIYRDDKIAIFRDHKPCAQFHLQVIPLQRIASVLSLRSDPEDVALVEHMLKQGREALKTLGVKNEAMRFGFHVPPFVSVEHLHMHALGGKLSLSGHCKYGHGFGLGKKLFMPTNFVLEELRSKQNVKDAA